MFLSHSDVSLSLSLSLFLSPSLSKINKHSFGKDEIFKKLSKKKYRLYLQGESLTTQESIQTKGLQPG